MKQILQRFYYPIFHSSSFARSPDPNFHSPVIGQPFRPLTCHPWCSALLQCCRCLQWHSGWFKPYISFPWLHPVRVGRWSHFKNLRRERRNRRSTKKKNRTHSWQSREVERWGFCFSSLALYRGSWIGKGKSKEKKRPHEPAMEIMGQSEMAVKEGMDTS